MDTRSKISMTVVMEMLNLVTLMRMEILTSVWRRVMMMDDVEPLLGGTVDAG